MDGAVGIGCNEREMRVGERGEMVRVRGEVARKMSPARCSEI
jgi:hypothetical protein